MIELRDAAMHYPSGDFALRGVTLRAAPGEFVVVVGASGAGKSSFLKILFGEQSITGGSVRVAGRELNQITPHERQQLRRELGIVFQDYRLLSRPIWENVALPLELRGLGRSARRSAAAVALEMVGLAGRDDAMPATLSGGEQQRVAIARALITRPKVILADEPTGNLDSKMSRAVIDLLLVANRAGTTMVLATHNLNLVEPYKLRTLVFDRGRLVGDFASTREVGNG